MTDLAAQLIEACAEIARLKGQLKLARSRSKRDRRRHMEALSQRDEAVRKLREYTEAHRRVQELVAKYVGT